MSVPLYQAEAEFSRMLGHSVWTTVPESPQGGPGPVPELPAAMEVGPSRLSQHLAILRRSGLVTWMRHGSGVLYEVADGNGADLPRAVRRIPTARSELPTELREAEVAAR